MQFAPTKPVSSVSVVVPCYNSEASLAPLLLRISAELSGEFKDFEVILVDDGSVDSTWDVILSLACKYEFVRGLQLQNNFGQHGATLCGIDSAVNDVVVTIDDDLQYNPSDVSSLLAAIEQGYDLVYGVSRGVSHGPVRAFLSWIVRSLMRCLGARDYSQVTSFRCFKRTLARSFSGVKGKSLCIDALLSWNSLKVGQVPIQVGRRALGSSGYNFSKLADVALDLILSDGTVAFRVFIAFSVVCGVLGLALSSWSIASDGFSLITVMPGCLFVLASLQFLGIGLALDYLQRLTYSVLQRPLYVIKSRTEMQDQTTSVSDDIPLLVRPNSLTVK